MSRGAVSRRRVDAAAIEAHDLELAVGELQRLAAARQPAELLHDQARHGVELVVRQFGLEVFVEFVDGRLAAHDVLAFAVLADVHVLVDVVLVVDVADDLLDHVFDGHEAGDAAVFVGDDGHVHARAAELAQQHVEPLGFRHEHRGPHEFLDVERRLVGRLRREAQQILGEQDADDLLAVLVHHRESASGRFRPRS